jgi:hypothetical protein
MGALQISEILERLNHAAELGAFPDFNEGYYHPLCARMHVFRDEMRWAIVVETVVYSDPGVNVMDVLYYIGNCITGGVGMREADFLSRVTNITELYGEERDKGVLQGPTIQVRGESIHFDGRFEQLLDVLRLLGDSHGALLLGTADEVRSRIPADLPELLQLDAWNHPDLLHESPSASPTFQLLAKAIVSGVATDYSPSLPPNTHWENWPDAGTF